MTTVPEINTIADGTAVQTPGDKLFPYLKENVDEIITIDDSELIGSFLDMAENHKMIVENSGLLTVAALKHLGFQGKKVVSVLSGGNMDVLTMATVVQGGLIERDRVCRINRDSSPGYPPSSQSFRGMSLSSTTMYLRM